MDALQNGPTLAEAYCVTEAEGLTLLGRGKFSVVHRTRRRADSVPVALKTIQIFEMGTKERNECPPARGFKPLLRAATHHSVSHLSPVMEKAPRLVPRVEKRSLNALPCDQRVGGGWWGGGETGTGP